MLSIYVIISIAGTFQDIEVMYVTDLRHLISIETVSLEQWEKLYALCRDIILSPSDFADVCRGKVMASLFYEPSTRTSFSFQTAMMRLGGSVFGFSDPGATSVSKGETLMDTVKICSAYADILVMRTPWEGSAMAASLYSEIPVINAGDGGHMHPTQTLTDLATICQKRGKIENLNVGLCGDLKNGRTVHSLILALSKFPNISFYLISPRDIAAPDYILRHLKERNQKYIEVTSLEASMPQLDILYMTRIQKERFTDPLEYERNKGVYVLTKRKLQRAKKDLLVMHPLPRVDEISIDVDSDPRAVYFEQARYGMYIRMALLLTMSAMPRRSTSPYEIGKEAICKNARCITQTESYLPNLSGQSNGKRYCLFCDKEIL
jgi:aspartate carbamoyltransferase catalytic subunit